MTTKVFFLNRLLIRNLDSILLMIFCSLTQANSCLANSERVNNRLPPPPPLSPPNRIIKTKESLAAPNNLQPPRSMVQNSQGEYIFTVPTQTETSYKVEVFGKSNLILQQVREIEPKAFIKGNIIQVGIFTQQDNAIDLVKQLALQGLWARVIVQ